MTGVSPLHRTAVLVADVDDSSTFYTDVLGLSLLYTEDDVPSEMLPQLNRLLGWPNGGPMRFRFFAAGEARQGWIALFEVASGLERNSVSRSGPMNVGEACLVLFHEHLDDVLSKLTAHGCEIVGGPETLVMGANRQREVIFRNRDMTLFNIIERQA